MKKILMAALAALAIIGCNKEKGFEVQKADAITVAPKESQVTADGGTVKVMVTSTGNWTLKGKADYSSWVTPSAVKGVDGDIVTFTVKTNANTENKVSEWEFACGKATEIFKLTSKGVIPDHLKLTSDANVVMSEKAGEVIVKFETSLGYRTLKHTMTNGAETWLKYLTTLEIEGGAEMHFECNALDGLKDRATEITVTGEGLGVEPVKVKVLQEAKRVLDIAQPFYTAPVGGGDVVVGISTNVKYEVVVSEEGKSWITPGEQKEGSITFKVAKLDGQKRSAKVTFKQTDAKEGATPLVAEVTISQLEVLVKWAANMKGNRLFPKWEGGGIGYTSKFTLELLVKFDEFASNRIIHTIMGIEGRFLLRMGDAGYKNNRLQLALSGFNYNIPDFEFETNRWYHLAVTSGGGNIRVYVDGQKVLDKPLHYQVELSPYWSYESGGSRCFWFGYSYEPTRDVFGQMTEMRIWNRTLTEEEINAPDHFYKVEPDAPGLYSYWPFTAGTGDSIEDATGKGNKLYGEKNVRRQYNINKGDAGIEWVKVALPEK